MKPRDRADVPEFLREAGAADRELLEALSALLPQARTPPQLLRERLLSTVSRPRLRFAPLFGALAELFDLGDAALADLFERSASPDAWSSTPIPGASLLHLPGGPRVATADCGLVRLVAGARFPMHEHLGHERVLVLQGGYRDEPSGILRRAGDVQEMEAGSRHAYTALPGEPLLLAVAVVAGVAVEGVGTLTPATTQR